MKKYDILKEINQARLVAVVRGNSVEEAILITDKIVAGGITGIEITYTTPNATKVIEELTNKYGNKICLGAGTVIDKSTAVMAIHAGAKYIVSPNFDEDIALACNKFHIPYLPGVMTVSEVVKAHTYGVDVVKLFPGGDVGMSFAKNIKGPLPHFNFMPTGGVSLENFTDWLDHGAFSVGIGGFLTAPAKQNNYDEITSISQNLVNIYKEYINE